MSSLCSCTLWLFIATSSIHCILSIDDIPHHYLSTEPLKSLFCNTCSVLSSLVNESLYDSSTDFESLVGFRLDSTGKKIRKQSGWLKLFLSLEDQCDDWKDQYRTAKRKNGYLYLIESDDVRAMEQIERKRKDKLEKEASERLNKQWDQEWEIEKLEKDRIYNETHDEYGNLIEVNTEDINDGNTEKEDEDDEDDDDDEEDAAENRYFYERKPKLVKKKSKQHKIVKEMCFFLNEHFDEWLHEQQKVIAKKMNESDEIQDYLEPLSFCLEDKTCKEEMFDTKPKIFKFKKKLNLPKKPKRTWKPPIKIVDEEYEEQMEDDIDDIDDKSEL